MAAGRFWFGFGFSCCSERPLKFNWQLISGGANRNERFDILFRNFVFFLFNSFVHIAGVCVCDVVILLKWSFHMFHYVFPPFEFFFVFDVAAVFAWCRCEWQKKNSEYTTIALWANDNSVEACNFYLFSVVIAALLLSSFAATLFRFKYSTLGIQRCASDTNIDWME